MRNLLDGTEGHTTQALQLQCECLTLFVLNEVNIGFLAHANLSSNGYDVATLHHGSQGEEIVAQVGQFVSIISRKSDLIK